MSLMLVKRLPNIFITVYAYGTPPCVDNRLAEAMKGHLSTVKDPTLNRVVVKNFIHRDDLVSRLSLTNSKCFVAEVKMHKERWEPFLAQVIDEKRFEQS
jgi:hypothetical protein